MRAHIQIASHYLTIGYSISCMLASTQCVLLKHTPCSSQTILQRGCVTRDYIIIDLQMREVVLLIWLSWRANWQERFILSFWAMSQARSVKKAHILQKISLSWEYRILKLDNLNIVWDILKKEQYFLSYSNRKHYTHSQK